MEMCKSTNRLILLVFFVFFIAFISYNGVFLFIASPRPAAGFLEKKCVSCGSLCLRVYLAILAIIRNEGKYLEEWIEYHLLVGVEKFYLAMNDNEDNSSEILIPYVLSGIVHLSSWPGRKQQKKVYNYYIRQLRNETCWVAIIDADEFLVPVETRSVSEILRRFENGSGITVNDVMFGSNGQQTRLPGLVLERFRNHTSLNIRENRFTKSIVNPRLIAQCDIHEHSYLSGLLTRDATGKTNIRPMLYRPAVHNVLRLNHYGTKSVEECRAKKARGWADRDFPGLIAMLFRKLYGEIAALHDIVANDTGIDWAIPLIKANLANRRESRRMK
jgi:hypothetical protein